MKVQVSATQCFYYADLVITCERMKLTDMHVSAPCLLIEVLSPSTATVDRREKLIAYRQLPTLHEYLIVDQDRMHVEVYRRDTSGVWPSDEFEEINGIADLTLHSLPGGDVRFSPESIYRGLDYSE